MDLTKVPILQKLVSDYLSDYDDSCSITSEGYPHGSYIEDSDDLIIYELIDKVNELLGQPTNVAQFIDHRPEDVVFEL